MGVGRSRIRVFSGRIADVAQFDFHPKKGGPTGAYSDGRPIPPRPIRGGIHRGRRKGIRRRSEIYLLFLAVSRMWCCSVCPTGRRQWGDVHFMI